MFGCENFRDAQPSSNITPLQSVPVIVRRRMGLARWGLLPDYAVQDDKTLCAKLKNARSETVADKPTFRDLWQRGRKLLIPASGFFEWPEIKIKGQAPFTITYPDSEIISFAGLWTKHDDLVTFTILTKEASPEISHIHSRMPVAFRPDQAEEWFGSDTNETRRMIETVSISNWHAEQAEPLQRSLLS